MNSQSAYLAPEGFEKELIEELGPRVVKAFDRLVLAEGGTDPVWVENIWRNPELIQVESIGDAAKKLRTRGAQAGVKLWSLYSVSHHRRATLIQEQLPKLKFTTLDFLASIPSARLGSWTLLEPGLVLASTDCTSVFPNGAMSFNEDKHAPPSRAYLKLWELFTVHGLRPEKGSRCLDLGSSPGGWTWVLAGLGAKVLSIDKAPLDPSIAKMPGVIYIKHNGFTLSPQEVGQVDWFFSDIICEPLKLYELVLKWREAHPQANFACTIKFKGPTDHETTRLFQTIPGSRVVHLHHNKHELTWFNVRSID